ncbi:glutaredoxin family protein [Rhizobacter sp. P5_C2]|jgi:glutaredoxin
MTRSISRTFSLAAPVLLAAMFTALPAHALYKVVGPDGKITYTDRPAVSPDNKVQSVNSSGGVSDDVALPYELRQVAQRYPVTLYGTKDCQPCDTARQMLRQRGIPFAEKSIATKEDGDALQRITGSRDLPAMTVGSQVLRGFQREDWNSYLDAAAYPKESKLPANFPQGSATPLTEPKQAVKASTPQNGNAPAAQPQQSSSGDSGSNPAGIKF